MRCLAFAIRSQFLLVVLATALPVWLAAAVLFYQAHVDARALVERDAGASARAVMESVDRDLAAAEAVGHTLATSQSLLAGDLARFYVRAKNAIERSGIGNNVVLTDASGQQVLNTLQPLGQPLPRHGNPDLVKRVFVDAKPVISDLYIGGLSRRPMMSVDVPVMLDRTVIYDLSIGMFPERQSGILRQQHLPASWIISVIDSTGTIIARSQNAARYVGGEGIPVTLTSGFAGADRNHAGQTLEGIQVSTVWTRSNHSGWTAAIGVPAAELTERLWRFLALSLVCTLVLIVANFAVAAGIGRRLVSRTVEHTEARVAQNAAEEAARVRSSYFAYLSHELRSPLTAVRGSSEIIATRSHDAKLLDHCARIERNVDHISAIIEQILRYARYEAGELTLCKSPLDVADELRNSLSLLESTAKQAGVMLQCHIEPQMPPLNADRTQLRQIMLNLLSNAIKFTPRGGTVTISAAQVGSDCVIRVVDTGIGISAEDLPRIMRPFAQVSSAQTGERSGTGLGLPLSKGLVEKHGGTMMVASVPGVGTTVTISLPSMAP